MGRAILQPLQIATPICQGTHQLAMDGTGLEMNFGGAV
jgi:hypothetical protein